MKKVQIFIGILALLIILILALKFNAGSFTYTSSRNWLILAFTSLLISSILIMSTTGPKVKEVKDLGKGEIEVEISERLSPAEMEYVNRVCEILEKYFPKKLGKKL